MVVSSRAVKVFGLGLVACLAGSAFGEPPPRDAGVRKTAAAAATPSTAPAPKALMPTIVGTVDIEAVLKGYDKVKTQQEEFKAAAMAKHQELLKLQTEGQEETSKLQKMTPNSVDAKKIEDRLTQIKAQIEAGQENAQRDFALRESEMLATLYKEIQSMVARVAEFKGMTFIVRVSNEPVAGSNPNSVMAAMSNAVVYANPGNDITKDVVHNLNLQYQAAGGVAPKATTPARGAPAGGN
jgi:Skp family chaperone for outer membrane proteins